MQRRQLIKSGIGLLAAAATPQPGRTQPLPEIKWRLTSSFSPSLDIIYGAAKLFAHAVEEGSDGRFQIEIMAPGEFAQALEAADAVSEGRAEIGHTASYYYVAKDPTFALGTGVPFGLNSRMQNAWMYGAGGIDILNEFYATHNIYALPAGNTGCQMGGWFRKEIKHPDELKGLKMRIGGMAGRVLEQLGVEPRQVVGSAIYAALENSSLDAATWVGPYDDAVLNLGKVAPFYYYPGWWNGGCVLHFFINLERWRALAPDYQTLLRAASERANAWMLAKYDVENPAALKRLVAAGVELRPFPMSVLEPCLKASLDLFNQLSEENRAFKKIWNSMLAFRNDQYLWYQLAEYSYDSFVIQTRTRT